ncbi:MAG: large conductance mechanosensitive channel protein MscL [Clostridia bacterium]|nr:large conductance mechanosensitive channel protein MscL [Clostridia bacterium]
MKKKGFFAEFKEFIMRGNVIDMAVGVIIATAFGKITTSLVNDVIMPAIGLLTSDGASFTEKLNWTITGTETTIGFGLFIETIINFLIIGFSVFVMIKIINKVREVAETKLLKKKEEEEVVAEEPKGPTTEELLSEILAELKKK